jgi:hypothetical protein
LDAIAAMDFHFALVILPNDSELDDALRDSDDGKDFLQFGAFLEERAAL